MLLIKSFRRTDVFANGLVLQGRQTNLHVHRRWFLQASLSAAESRMKYRWSITFVGLFLNYVE